MDGDAFAGEIPPYVPLQDGGGSDPIHDIEVVSLLESTPDPSLNPLDLVYKVLIRAPNLERPHEMLDLGGGHVLLQINDSSVVMQVKLLYAVL